MALSDDRKAKLAAVKARIMDSRHPGRALDRSLANDREASQRVNENRQRLLEHMRELAAKNTYESPRRDLLADRDIFHEIQLYLAKGDTVRLSGRSPAPVGVGVGVGKGIHPLHVPLWERMKKDERARVKRGDPPDVIKRRIPVHHPEWEAIESIARSRRRRGEREHLFWVPRWEDTGPMLKMLAWAMVLHERGGKTLNLNLAPSVVEAAHRDTRPFAQHLRERIKRELTDALKPLNVACPDFFFAVEASEFGKTHLHGAILAGWDEDVEKVVRDALFHAVTGRRAERTGREVKLMPLETPVKWANYCAKWWRGAAFDEDGRVFAATSGLRSLAGDWYREARRTEAPIAGHDQDAIDNLLA